MKRVNYNLELQNAVNALNASEHNPIEWAPIIRFIAPIVGRIAVQQAVTLISRITKKRISPKVRTRVVDEVATKMAEVVIKQAAKPKK